MVYHTFYPYKLHLWDKIRIFILLMILLFFLVASFLFAFGSFLPFAPKGASYSSSCSSGGGGMPSREDKKYIFYIKKMGRGLLKKIKLFNFFKVSLHPPPKKANSLHSFSYGVDWALRGWATP